MFINSLHALEIVSPCFLKIKLILTIECALLWFLNNSDSQAVYFGFNISSIHTELVIALKLFAAVINIVIVPTLLSCLALC